jgi:hypothetical protein
MATQQDQQVTVRFLPDGHPQTARFDTLSGLSLSLNLSPLPAQSGLNAGDLVEVTCPATLYLGVVRSRQGERMMIAIEHALDRETLAAIQQVWHGPADR